MLYEVIRGVVLDGAIRGVVHYRVSCKFSVLTVCLYSSFLTIRSIVICAIVFFIFRSKGDIFVDFVDVS